MEGEEVEPVILMLPLRNSIPEGCVDFRRHALSASHFPLFCSRTSPLLPRESVSVIGDVSLTMWRDGSTPH